MTGEQIVGLVLALVLMFAGTAGSLLPGIPSTPLVFLAAVAHRLYFGVHGASNLVLVALAAAMILSLGLDYVAGVVGARKLGATWRGMAGALAGMIVGLCFNLPGMILGPIAGAVLFEKLGGRRWDEATRAGAGALLGLVVGALGKLVFCLGMTALFTVNVIMRSGGPEAASLAVR